MNHEMYPLYRAGRRVVWEPLGLEYGDSKASLRRPALLACDRPRGSKALGASLRQGASSFASLLPNLSNLTEAAGRPIGRVEASYQSFRPCLNDERNWMNRFQFIQWLSEFNQINQAAGRPIGRVEASCQSLMPLFKPRMMQLRAAACLTGLSDPAAIWWK